MALRDWLYRRFGKDRRRPATDSPAPAPLQNAAPRTYNAMAALTWDMPSVTEGRRAEDNSDKLSVAESLGLHGNPQAGLDVLVSQRLSKPDPPLLLVRSWLHFLLGATLEARRGAISAMRGLPAGEASRLAALRCAWIHLSTWELDIVEEALGILNAQRLFGPWGVLAQLCECSLLALQGSPTIALSTLPEPQQRVVELREPALFYHLAVTQNDLGQHDKSLESLATALKRKFVPETGKALLWLEAARAFSNLRRTEEAANAYDLVLHSWPGIRLSKSSDKRSKTPPAEEALLAKLH